MTQRPRPGCTLIPTSKAASNGAIRHRDDIGQAIVFLADSKRSGFVNGHALAVDGGW